MRIEIGTRLFAPVGETPLLERDARLMLVAPGYAERMENQLIVQAQFAGIEDGLPGPNSLW